jgi:hypothetical protein
MKPSQSVRIPLEIVEYLRKKARPFEPLGETIRRLLDLPTPKRVEKNAS